MCGKIVFFGLLLLTVNKMRKKIPQCNYCGILLARSNILKYNDYFAFLAVSLAS
jgi:hypothetical protein